MLNITSSGKVPPWNVCVDIESVTVSMQLDTDPSLFLMAETTFREHWPQKSLSSSQVSLCSYSGETIYLYYVGVVNVKVMYKGQSHQVP